MSAIVVATTVGREVLCGVTVFVCVAVRLMGVSGVEAGRETTCAFVHQQVDFVCSTGPGLQ